LGNVDFRRDHHQWLPSLLSFVEAVLILHEDNSKLLISASDFSFIILKKACAQILIEDLPEDTPLPSGKSSVNKKVWDR